MTDCFDCVFFHIDEDTIDEWYTYCDKKHELYGFESKVKVCGDYCER